MTVVNEVAGIAVTTFLTEREKFVGLFNALQVKTAQASLEMSRVVYEAKQQLSKKDFDLFCRDIGRKTDCPTIRKYIKIGSVYDRFILYVHLLPSCWTSIYALTQLSPEVFETLALADQSMANLTGAHIKKLLDGQKGDSSKPSASAPTADALAVDAPVAQETLPQAPENSANTPNKIQEVASAPATPVAAEAESSGVVADASVDSQDKGGTDSKGSLQSYAVQATKSMLARISNSHSASAKVVEDEEFVPYSFVIHFRSKPSEDAVRAIQESLYQIKSQYHLDIEFDLETAGVN